MLSALDAFRNSSSPPPVCVSACVVSLWLLCVWVLFLLSCSAALFAVQQRTGPCLAFQVPWSWLCARNDVKMCLLSRVLHLICTYYRGDFMQAADFLTSPAASAPPCCLTHNTASVHMHIHARLAAPCSAVQRNKTHTQDAGTHADMRPTHSRTYAHSACTYKHAPTQTCAHARFS